MEMSDVIRSERGAGFRRLELCS